MKLPEISSCDRVNFIMERIFGKNTLHLGCGDWPFTEKKVRRGSLLHQRMEGIASDLTGVDLEPDAVELMQEAGLEKIYLGNSEDSLYESLQQKFDVIVAGEVLEHVLNAGDFLKSISSVCHEDSIVIITIPNFAPIKRLPRLIVRKEVIHPDHVYYFSYSTLTCLLSQCGFEPLEWKTYWRDVGKISKLVNSVFRRISFFQYFADGFCLVCRPNSKTS
jgi:2-polyprenyl-3-methyl-5-hydroxy-6-metoxy-1,4-benzoquinol methylase